MTPLPVIAIVGRPNVGKSSLLNALVGKRISIVQDMPGVTRDRVSYPFPINAGTEARHDFRYVEMVDTGGYGFVDPDQLTEHIRHQIELAMTRANLVLFLVDCEAGLTAGDEQIASLLRRQGIKSVLIANKCDGPKADVALGEFARLGFGTPVGVSAKNERNLDQVLRAIKQNVDLSNAPTEIPPPEMHIAIVGKRNAGKSTLVNAIAKQYEGDPERVIVSEVPGTTRDSVDVRFEKEGKSLVVIDTAGVRKKRHMVTNDIEFYSFHRAQRSIRRADVVLLLIDGGERVSEPDKKLAQYIAEQYKPVILVINKFDLVIEAAEKQAEEHGSGFSPELLMDEFEEYLRQELRFLDYAPIAFITAKDGKNIQVLLDLTQKIFKQANLRLSTSKLNQAVRSILQQRTPSTPSGRRAKVFYATQIETAPPTIVLVVNKPEYLDETYQRFMINRMREILPYSEVPIRLLIRPRGQGASVAARSASKSLDERSEEEVNEATAPASDRPERRPARPAPRHDGGRPKSSQAKTGGKRAKPARQRPFRSSVRKPAAKRPAKKPGGRGRRR